LGIAVGWALVCCIEQPNAYANLVYLAIFAANIYVCLVVAPSLLLPHFGVNAIVFFAAPIFLTNLANLASGLCGVPGAYFMGRLRGLSINTLEAGVLGWIGIVLALWIIVDRPVKFGFGLLLAGGSFGVVLLSRTRSYMLAALIGSCIMLAGSLRSNALSSRRVRVLVLFMVLLFTLLGIAVGTNVRVLERAREYLRISGSPDEILEARMVHWLAGVQFAEEHPILGRGPMAKFGNATNPMVNTYEMEACFVNTWLTMAQSYGIPGAVLFALSILTMLVLSFRGFGTIPVLSTGLLAAGIASSFSATWLVSFGDVGDRAMLLLLGITLATGKRQKRVPVLSR
jgi:hypothetical protein